MHVIFQFSSWQIEISFQGSTCRWKLRLSELLVPNPISLTRQSIHPRPRFKETNFNIREFSTRTRSDEETRSNWPIITSLSNKKKHLCCQEKSWDFVGPVRHALIDGQPNCSWLKSFQKKWCVALGIYRDDDSGFGWNTDEYIDENQDWNTDTNTCTNTQIHKYRYNSDTNTDKNALQMKRIGAAGQQDEDSGLKETRALPFSPLHWLCTAFALGCTGLDLDRGGTGGKDWEVFLTSIRTEHQIRMWAESRELDWRRRKRCYNIRWM